MAERASLITIEPLESSRRSLGEYAMCAKITNIADAAVAVEYCWGGCCKPKNRIANIEPGGNTQDAIAGWYERDRDWIVAEQIKVSCGSRSEVWVADHPASVPWSEDRSYSYMLQAPQFATE